MCTCLCVYVGYVCVYVCVCLHVCVGQRLMLVPFSIPLCLSFWARVTHRIWNCPLSWWLVSPRGAPVFVSTALGLQASVSYVGEEDLNPGPLHSKPLSWAVSQVLFVFPLHAPSCLLSFLFGDKIPFAFIIPLSQPPKLSNISYAVMVSSLFVCLFWPRKYFHVSYEQEI